MEDLKNISYDNLRKIIDAIQEFNEEIDEIASSSHECIRLWENEQINSPVNAIVDYLDQLLDEEASYFIYECGFGKKKWHGKPFKIISNDKEYEITDFDSWYSFLLETQGKENDS